MDFKQGQLVLRYIRKNEIKPRKFKVRWLGAFKISKIKENGAIKLSTLDNKPIRDLVNGSKLKAYERRNKLVSSYFINIKEERGQKAKRESEQGGKTKPSPYKETESQNTTRSDREGIAREGSDR